MAYSRGVYLFNEKPDIVTLCYEEITTDFKLNGVKYSISAFGWNDVRKILIRKGKLFISRNEEEEILIFDQIEKFNEENIFNWKIDLNSVVSENGFFEIDDKFYRWLIHNSVTSTDSNQIIIDTIARERFPLKRPTNRIYLPIKEEGDRENYRKDRTYYSQLEDDFFAPILRFEYPSYFVLKQEKYQRGNKYLQGDSELKNFYSAIGGERFNAYFGNEEMLFSNEITMFDILRNIFGKYNQNIVEKINKLSISCPNYRYKNNNGGIVSAKRYVINIYFEDTFTISALTPSTNDLCYGNRTLKRIDKWVNDKVQTREENWFDDGALMLSENLKWVLKPVIYTNKFAYNKGLVGKQRRNNFLSAKQGVEIQGLFGLNKDLIATFDSYGYPENVYGIKLLLKFKVVDID